MKGRQPGRLGGIVPLGEGMIDWSEALKAAMMSPMADHGYIIEIETEVEIVFEYVHGVPISFNLLVV